MVCEEEEQEPGNGRKSLLLLLLVQRVLGSHVNVVDAEADGGEEEGNGHGGVTSSCRGNTFPKVEDVC